MTPIESLKNRLESRFPEGDIYLDRPKLESGIWFMDVVVGRQIIVCWQESKGFGVSRGGLYGEGCDEAFLSEDAVYDRVVSLLGIAYDTY